MKIKNLFYPKILYIYLIIYIVLSIVSLFLYRFQYLTIIVFYLLLLYSISVFFVIGYRNKQKLKKLSIYCFSFLLVLQIIVFIISFYIETYITKPWIYFYSQNSQNIILTKAQYISILVKEFIIDIIIYEIIVIGFLILGRYLSIYNKKN